MNYKAFRLVGKGRFYLLERFEKMKKNYFLFLLLSAFCTLATGCGVKGPLYFPEKETAAKHTKNTIKTDRT